MLLIKVIEFLLKLVNDSFLVVLFKPTVTLNSVFEVANHYWSHRPCCVLLVMPLVLVLRRSVSGSIELNRLIPVIPTTMIIVVSLLDVAVLLHEFFA